MNAQATNALLIQIRHMEAQLRAMRRQLRNLTRTEAKPAHTLADLRGKWAVPGGISEEEIDAVLYRLTPEREDEIATLPRRDAQ
jgi:hypothetical protein